MASILKDYEKIWISKIENGELDGISVVRNSSYEDNNYQRIMTIDDGEITLTKRNKVPTFDNKEWDRDWHEETKKLKF